MEKETKSIDYYLRPGYRNTGALIEAVRSRADELEIKHVVVATNSGKTAIRFWEGLQGRDVTLIAVTGTRRIRRKRRSGYLARNPQ